MIFEKVNAKLKEYGDNQSRFHGEVDQKFTNLRQDLNGINRKLEQHDKNLESRLEGILGSSIDKSIQKYQAGVLGPLTAKVNGIASQLSETSSAQESAYAEMKGQVESISTQLGKLNTDVGNITTIGVGEAVKKQITDQLEQTTRDVRAQNEAELASIRSRFAEISAAASSGTGTARTINTDGIEVVTRGELQAWRDEQRRSEDIAVAHKVLIWGLEGKSHDERWNMIQTGIQKMLDADSMPTKNDLSTNNGKTGALAAVSILTFKNIPTRKKAEPALKNGALGKGTGMRVLFGSTTDAMNKNLIQASHQIINTLWPAVKPDKNVQRARVRILFREGEIHVDGEKVVQRNSRGDLDFLTAKYKS